LISPENIKAEKKYRINIEMLKDLEVKTQYQMTIDKAIEEIDENNVELDWQAIRKTIIKVAEQNINDLKRSKNACYNSQCQKAVEKRRKARGNHLRWRTSDSQILFISERTACKKIIQQEKRKFFNNILQIAEEDRSQNRIRNFFRTIKRYKQFNPYMESYKKPRWTNNNRRKQQSVKVEGIL